MDINQYILPQQQTFLESVNYQVLQLVAGGSRNVLTIMDVLSANVINDKQIKVVFGRQLAFQPVGLFDLSVSFGAILTFKEGAYEKENWSSYDLSKEIIDNSPNIINNLAARTSLVISEITSSFGQNPIITPPNFHKQNKGA